MSPEHLDLRMAIGELESAREAFANATNQRQLAEAVSRVLCASRWIDQLLARHDALPTAVEQRKQQTRQRTDAANKASSARRSARK